MKLFLIGFLSAYIFSAIVCLIGAYLLFRRNRA